MLQRFVATPFIQSWNSINNNFFTEGSLVLY